mmetsp:Transcript_25219/g.42249  ORF Transcript_25219/g.42249 Transcript_25219/m.42249 type:complete len:86 (-) Transcript_25219:1179-1436(-)
MCPLRFVLIFLSAVLAAFLAFTSYSESRGFTDPSPDESPEDNTTEESKKIEKNSEKVSSTTYLSALVDMATGRYLYNQYRQRKSS